MTFRLRSLALGFALAAVTGARASGQSDAMADMASRTNIHGFTDVSYLTGGANTGRTSAFGLGQFDLYITSSVADRLSFLGETVFEYDDALRNRHEEKSAAYSRTGALGGYAVTKRSLAVSFNQTM